MKSCPICRSRGEPLLSLRRQPIYQHPVPAGVEVPAPHVVDLEWFACEDCAHAWQPDFDAEMLSAIYRNFYYTPAPDGMGGQFREDFFAALDRFGLLREGGTLLEIGASSGDVLSALATRVRAKHAYAFEPNAANAVVARARGLDVREEFFGVHTVRDCAPADLIYSRHVIEHIFQFDDFFAGLDAASAPSAALILETPSLDFHAARGTIDPFHVEHIHVFASRSLARLAGEKGWTLRGSEVTPAGNLIAWFARGERAADIPRPDLSAVQLGVDARRTRLRALLGARPLVFWGAGSSGVSLATALGREPELWTDGNPAKVGKHFVGLSGEVVEPIQALARAQANYENPALVVTSTFVKEILPRVRELGWCGDVFDCEGNSL
ncbi:MAG: methyltransferase domain-containing protein [Pseudomonadota bacterium]